MAKLTLHRLLTQGYFPEELPPPFGTSAFANYLSRRAHSKWPFIADPPSSRPEIYYLARAGTLRRPLAILNPIHFSSLAKFVVTNWDELRAATAKSRISLTSPVVGGEGRAVGRRLPFRVLAERRAQLRSGGRFLVRADISRFYQSIYTHSVPWALHGKAFAKRFKNAKNVGNQFDGLLRRCQDNQTNGIPIGPDSSLLVAEIVLSAIDERLRKHAERIIRYMDDYEIIAETEGDALHLLAELQNELLKFELHLNPSKTGVYPLPIPLEQRWTVPLHQHLLDPFAKTFKTQVIQFFDTAFELSLQFPNESVLKYAIGRIANLELKADHTLVEDLLLQSARIQPGTIPLVLRIILSNPKSFSRKGKRSDLLFRTILRHAPQGHSSEVAWSIWACIVLKINLPRDCVAAVLRMEDSVCALLLLHAGSEGLANLKRAGVALEPVMIGTELYDNRWLLCYEGNIKGWVKLPAGDHVSNDPNFSQLKRGGVSFYDTKATHMTAHKAPLGLASVPAVSQQLAALGGEEETMMVDTGYEF